MLQTAQVNAIAAVLLASTDNIEVDAYLDPKLQGIFAASNNIEIDVTNETATADTARALGERELKIAEFNASGVAVAGTYLSLGKLISGTNTPQPTATTVDEVYHNGATQTIRTGVTNGAPTWTISGYDSDPEIALLIDYAPISKANPSGKEGRPLAYLSYNLDRSFLEGKLTVISAYERGTDGSAWVFTVTFSEGKYHPSSQNPLAGGGNVPQAADFTPKSGPIGTTITARGVNMDAVSEVRLGSQATTTLTGQTPTQVSFDVPAGATLGDKAVVLVYGDDDEDHFIGLFEVTA